MTGMRSVLSNLDLTVQGSVKFGDGSIVSIEGLGSMIMTGKNGEHKVLTNMYYIPKLQSNIISLGQLEEAGCKIEMEDGWLQVFDRVDQGRRLIVITPKTENRLYKLHIRPTTPVVLMLNITNTT
jgi:nitrogen fixation protein